MKDTNWASPVEGKEYRCRDPLVGVERKGWWSVSAALDRRVVRSEGKWHHQ